MLALALFFSDAFYFASVFHRVQNGFAFLSCRNAFQALGVF
jgi:hypothetical protein